MSYQEFIIKAGSNGLPPRIGQIVDSSPNSPEFVVVWNDNGDQESIRASGKIVRAREGSLTYLLKTAPESITALFAEQPIELLKSVLVDNNFAPKSNKEITEALVNRAKIDEAAVVAMWKKNKPLLLSLEGVSTQGNGGNVKYKFAKPVTDLAAKKARSKQKKASSNPVVQTQEVEHEIQIAKEETTDEQKLQLGIQVDTKENPSATVIEELQQSATVSETSTSANPNVVVELSIEPVEVIETTKIPESTLPVSAVYVLGGLLGIHEPSDSSNILSSGIVVDYLLAAINKSETAKPLASKISASPLSAGILLEELSNKLIAGACKKLTKQQLVPIHSAALSASKQTVSLLPGFQDWLSTGPASKALIASVNDFKSSSATPSSSQREALINAFTRILEVNPECALPLDTVICGLINSLEVKGDREYVTKNLTERLVKEIKENNKLKLESSVLLDLGNALSDHSFNSNGPRSTILASLGHSDPELVENLVWWRGLDFEDLEGLNTTPLGALLSKEPFASDIVSPLVRTEISSLSTRKGLSKIFGAPAFALEFVSPSDIESIMHRVSKSDKNAKSWLEVLSRSGLVEELNGELEVAKELNLALGSQNESLSRQLDDLKKKNELLQAQIDKSRNEAGTLSVRERRQISIDAYRDLARVAATIEGEAEKLTPDQLLSKVNALLDRSAITRSTKVGERVGFDPRLHMSPGGRPENGSLVTVLRSGYQWFDGQEDVVLVEALVSSAVD